MKKRNFQSTKTLKIYFMYGVIWVTVCLIEWLIIHQIGTDHFYALLIAPFIGMFATDAIRIHEQEHGSKKNH